MQRSDQSSRPGRLYLSVAQDLLTAVARGDYSPGVRLPGDRELAGRLDVSRATVREAILALELIGAVEVRHGDGTYVRGPHPGVAGIEESALDVAPKELIGARRALEPVVASLAAAHADPDTLRALGRNVDEAAELVDEPAELPRFMDLGLRFHAVLAAGCGNSLLAEIVGQFVSAETHPLWLLVNQHAVSSPAARAGQLREHRAVLAALAGGDADAARDAMSAHLASVDTVIFQ
ncbi:FadR/GntR family transcriptional regulator [Pseudonocardia acaciae]|uniref:FadR/GntR family transcriptional regulator n=1 Tax=Pseudonocardia acaciae TaxID=551276 RepID=UPI00048B8EA7|nr:FCD domain-containing protein [Pseudonocardia acaciae]